ncbi:sugar phosphate isomerase/epimerase family protein [Akkermansia muciniphila]|uniref:sugar phosphate isomerase/epimerase family protein n=1 Tax=Akkermansia muciniphila TaxID=239935 RepID=UPI00122F0684|nr:sugar phosphate isomerase/epimerase family protein [Akkermansia muciniphila]KAA3384978.1 sugar phosphate isomerase/epimerase [Akkermansia muciniphila]
MKLGLQSAILAKKNFREVVDICGQIGYEALEVMCWPKGKALRRYGGVTHLDIVGQTWQELCNELAYAKEKGVEVSALGYYPNPLSGDQNEAAAAIELLNILIQVAKDTGVGMVTTFIGRDKEKTVEENLLAFKEVWSPLIDLAEKNQVKVAIENCPMFFTQAEWPGGNNLACTPAIWKEMFSLIDSDQLGLNYDPSHCVILDIDHLRPLYDFSKKIFHIHFKDTKLYRDKLDQHGRLAYPLAYMAPKLPGLGDIDWAAFCSALYDIGFTGYACVEAEDRAFEEDEEAVLRGLRLAYDHIRPYIG